MSIAGCERVRDADLCRLVGRAPPEKLPAPPAAPGGAALARRSSRRASAFQEEGFLGKTPPPKDCGGVLGLTRLDVSACVDVRARGLRALAERCTELRDLTLVGCAAVGDDACDALARCGRRLRHLDLSDCPLVTEAGVTAPARAAVNLENSPTFRLEPVLPKKMHLDKFWFPRRRSRGTSRASRSST